MSVYHFLKSKFTKDLLHLQGKILVFNITMNARKSIKSLLKKPHLPQLTAAQKNAAKAYYQSRCYTLKNTYWHSYYTAISGEFHAAYLPLDIFRPLICPRLNQKRQWPALLDKNLTYNLFKDFKQPNKIIQNINGFYYLDERIVDEEFAVKACNMAKQPLIIKPTLESGKGKRVQVFTVQNSFTSINNLEVLELFKLYNRDFIVQELVEQCGTLSQLNPTSLNTLRVVSYLRQDGVHILSAAIRIGETGSVIDNASGGGMFCCINQTGALNSVGYTIKGDIKDSAPSGVALKGQKIPNYDLVVKMVQDLHVKVPYFRIVSWDIGITKDEKPIFIEYNTVNQCIDFQIANGPFFGKFSDEILTLGLNPI